MARRTESVFRTLLRIEAIALQGVFYTILGVLFCIIVSPYTLVAQYCRLVVGGFFARVWWKAWLMLLPYMGLALLDTLLMPFVALAMGISDIVKVSRAEWQNRALDASHGDSRDYLVDVLNDYAPAMLKKQGEADGEDDDGEVAG